MSGKARSPVKVDDGSYKVRVLMLVKLLPKDYCDEQDEDNDDGGGNDALLVHSVRREFRTIFMSENVFIS